MSKITELEVRFNAKSTSQNIEEALKVATKHGADIGGKTCAVRFTDAADPDLQKLLNLVAGIKGTKMLVNGQEQKPKSVLDTLTCPDRPVCKGACKHFRLGYQRLEEFLLWHKQDIKGTTLTTMNASLLTHLTSFLEAQKENEYIMKKELLRDHLAEQTKFETEFCEKYQSAKLDEVVKQFPSRIVLSSLPPHLAVTAPRRGVVVGRPVTAPLRRREARPVPRYARYIDTYYRAQIHGQVLQHYLAALLHQAFPDKVEAPPALSPDSLILGLGLIPEAQKGQFYAQLADTAPEPQALNYWKKAVELERDPGALADLYVSRGERLIEGEQPEAATRLLQEGLKKCGDDILLLERLAELAVEQKDLKAAVEYLRRVLEVAPEEWDEFVEVSAGFAPLQALPEFQVLKKKYGAEG